jgi:hypothetical protein
MNKKDIRDSIEISDKLDDNILKGIERGRQEKQFIKRKNKMGTVAKVSSILIIGTLGIGVVNPDIIRAIPIIGKAIEGFDSSNFGVPTDKYLKYSQGVELISQNKKATVTLNDVIIDENMCMFGFVIESDALKGDKGKNSGDFINIDSDITLNGKRVDGIGHRARKIDNRTGAVVISANIAELDLENDVKVDLKISSIRGEKEVRGNWNFKLKTNKVEGSKRKIIGGSYDIKGQKLIVDEIVTSPLANTVMLSGIDDVENYTLQSTKFKVIDDNGNILRSNICSSSVDNKTGKFFSKLEIASDLSNSKYIELIPYWEMDVVNKEVEGIYVDLLTTTGSGEREEVLISRKPTKEELKSGYALSKVYYNLNMDKAKEFLSIEELKGYEIPVNNKDKVMIQDIKVSEENTKIIMKKHGDYDHLSQLVLFDEKMNDTAIWEGHIGAVVEDEKEGIYSITLDKIDPSKKYKIAIPMTKDIDLNSKYKIKINLD